MNTIFRTMAAAAALLFALAASARAGEVALSCAASLRDAADELAGAYTARNPGTVFRKNYGASGTLAKQIENGAPADIFIPANDEWMEYLRKKRLIADTGRGILAYNALVFAGPSGKNVSAMADLPRLERIAVGSPKSVPAGEYAVTAMKNAGIFPAMEKKLVTAKDVREALLYAERGEVDGAFVYRTDILRGSRVRILFEVPAGLYPRVTYPAALTTTGAKNPHGQRFLGFLLSPEAGKVLAKYGFTLK
jgi:molybdate transport system substrate-binding protein